MDAQPTIRDLLFSGYSPAELATLVETGRVFIRDRYGRIVVADGELSRKLLDQIAHHREMVAERNKPWKLWSEDALDYWAYGKTGPNRDYGGDTPPEIDRAWLKSPLKSSLTNTASEGKPLAGTALSNERWAPYNLLKKEAFDHAVMLTQRSNLMHNQMRDILVDSGLYSDLSKDALLKIAAEACDALGVGEDRVKGRKTRAK